MPRRCAHPLVWIGTCLRTH
ncbi:hypothetical protein D3230_00665 [Leucobacter chromiireducens subsp. solipictus]|uniref:Uncharacterized protein n=1 Tax=Leucobacter chromiireducens subsp. solipictus TaxID=398235 RepID=A0ABS1SE85_9MICO|nr:hypothetical protein [Leucobacter chromiireducens subsp. solipictus]